MELDLQVSPEEITSREVELGCESWTSFASNCSSTAVQRTLSLWLPKHGSETAIAQCTSRWAMARGHRLNISIALAEVHGLSGLFRAVSAVEPSLFRPLPPPPPLSPSLISHLASVDVKQNGPKAFGQSPGAVWKSRWSSWAFRPNQPYGFRGRKAMLNHWSQLVSNMLTDILGH